MIKSTFKFFLNWVPRPLLIRVSYLVKPFLLLSLKGNKYTDPIDGRSFSKFLPYGYENPRDNVLSPSTLSLERHRLLWLYLKDHTDFFTAHLKVLHFAPEQAFYKRFRELSNLDYTTTDLNSPLADIKADIRDLPFDDNSFDFILCNHVLEHVPNDTKAIAELYRVLSPGGTAILQVPQDRTRENTFEDDSITDPKERARIFGQYDHVRIYGRDFFDRLQAAGFKVEKVDLTSNMDPDLVARYCLENGEIIPVARK